ncbi:hypothetical protein IHE44_0010067 [Lamprotornis superbus]|uniref:protein-tyrosine-phosphatase n=1 Tax=Lamprotornis superbus TaxID=245042 RepID=A0A835NHZ1_9PASS|nr:hypothetical protein IHE44_0010067 [Lamprotornis superbus]
MSCSMPVDHTVIDQVHLLSVLGAGWDKDSGLSYWTLMQQEPWTRTLLLLSTRIVGSDYINANYIDGYRKQNAYIATQGPLPETFGDFWRMVWEQRSATIVMMTKLEEKSRIKCDQYWPGRGADTYGMIQVTLLDTIELATFCVRTFSLHKNGSSEKREVRQFQFTAWPDHGVPEYPTPFLAFLRRVKTCNPPDAGPIVVHCSAGVGRTGCFIVIDAMLERIKHEKTVDIYGHVTLMRSQRNYMVQTEDQYSFIHDALLEAVACGNTEVPARNLYSYIQKLAQIEAREHVTGMELEFKRLANSKAHTSRFISANLPCNKFKNRLVNIMPYESTRVCLQPIRGVEGSDYINASFIDGYSLSMHFPKLLPMQCCPLTPPHFGLPRKQKAYIATQGPLAETTEDFWRMLWENNSTIVDGQSRTVRQFQFTDWPEQGVPKSGEGFIDFIGQVHKTKEQFGQDGPISVHCSAGVGRTGVFITLSIVLERMRYEGVVDIFQTVKMLRTQRPAMVQTEDKERELQPPELAVGGSPSPCWGWGLWGFLGPFPAHLAFLGAEGEEMQLLAQALCTPTPHCCPGVPLLLPGPPETPAEIDFQNPPGPWCQPLASEPSSSQELLSGLAQHSLHISHIPNMPQLHIPGPWKGGEQQKG